MKLENVADVYPLSPMQEGMLFHSISEPESGVYIDQVAVTLDGPLIEQQFAAAIKEVSGRHSALRTVFVWDGVDQPLQIVRETVDFPVELIDWQEHSADQLRQRMLQHVEANQTVGFELTEAPLLKFALIRLSAQRWTLLLTFHHLILDGWSTHVLLKEILQRYQGVPTDASAPFAFKDYIRHLQNHNSEAANEYWRRALDGFESANSIGPPADRAVSRDQYCQTSQSLAAETTAAIKQLARDCQVSLNTVVQAAWGLTISRYSGGDDDVVFGVTVAGRPHELSGIESAVGSFINTMPLRLKVDPAQTVAHWLQQIQSSQSEARQWDSSSLVEVQKHASLPAGASLFESILVFENYPAAGAASDGLKIGDIEHFERSNYPLALLVVPSDELKLIAVHEASRYPVSFATRMLEHVAWLLEGFAITPEQQVGLFLDLPPQHQQLLTELESSPVTADKHTELIRVDDVIGSIASTEPDKVAAVFQDQQLTYGELNSRAERVAEKLRSAELKPGSIVGVCVERSFEMLVGILAAMKADASYLPLDPSYPQSHLQFVIDDAKVEFALTDAKSNRVLPGGNFTSLLIDDAADTATRSQSVAQRVAASDQLAYVIYTSGSSGQPKGVMVSHANLAFSTAARKAYYDQPPKCFLLLSSFAFDSSVAGLFGTLTSGGTIVLPATDQEKDVEALADLIQTHQVSHLLCLPSLYRLLLSAGDGGKLESLQIAIVAGEVIGETAAAHFDCLPETQLHNEYGPTEGTVWATACRVQATDRNRDVPIGTAIPGASIRLIGKDRRPVGHGSVGEICVAGPGVAVGYLNRDELTAQQFIELQNSQSASERVYRTGDAGYFREDGQLMFSGRIDRQVKIRGHRIEPATVEHHLCLQPSVSEAVVTASAGNASQRLVAYVVGEDKREGEIKSALSESLPQFMVPDVILFLDAFPRLANGKVDTGSLPDFSRTLDVGSFLPSRNETETKLVEIWQDTIGVDQIGIDQNFFTLGGDSIISIQVISRARRAGIALQPKHIAQHPTIAELAAVADASRGITEVANDDGGEFPLSPIQQWFFDMNMPQVEHWNQSALFELPADYDVDRLQMALKDTVAAHPQLWARFRHTEQGWKQSVSPVDKESLLIERESADFADSASFHQLCLHWQSSLELEQGPMFRLIVLQDDSKDAADRLLFVVHHLVIDTVSWQILIDDVVQQYNDGRAMLPVEPCSFGRFVKQLESNVKASAGLETGLAYWQGVLNSVEQLRLPLNEQAETITEGGIATESRTLTPELTNTLRGEANSAFSTTPHQLLLSALALAVADWTGHSVAAFNLESHGRSGWGVEEMDLSRTVGWMTSIFPAVLSVENDVAATVKLVKDQLNQLTQRGIEFGAFKHFADSPDENRIDDCNPEILFNFLGVQRSDPNQLLHPLPLEPQSCRAEGNPRQYPIEINAVVREGLLNIEFSYWPPQVHESVAVKLADGFVSRLQQVINACVNADRAYTTSDFPEAELSQSELDEFLDTLD